MSEYNEIMFLREITHTINAFNEDGRRCKALFQETKSSRTKACKSFIRSLIRRFRIGIVRQPGYDILTRTKHFHQFRLSNIERRHTIMAKRICKKKRKEMVLPLLCERDASGNLVQKECVGTESKE